MFFGLIIYTISNKREPTTKLRSICWPSSINEFDFVKMCVWSNRKIQQERIILGWGGWKRKVGHKNVIIFSILEEYIKYKWEWYYVIT